VRVGNCRNLDDVRQKLAEQGEVPPDQWIEAFKKAYPKNDGNGRIGVADPSWMDRHVYVSTHFPGLSGRRGGKRWHPGFFSAGVRTLIHDHWRWLVAN
jgi:hypothetical protein